MFTSVRPLAREVRVCLFVHLISFFVALLLAPRAVAQEERSGQDGVTPTELFIYGSNFRDPLGAVPQSTTVVQEERFTEKGETNFQYEIESIPNLTWSGGTSRPRFFIIRGVGELEQYDGAPNPSVATIIDDIDFSGLGMVVPMFDVQQLEVLRGPQGIRFGSSALAGAINVRSHDPSDFNTGTLVAMAGNDDMGAGGLAVGGAVPGSDGKVQLRFSAFNQQSDGFRENVHLSRDDTNSRNESVVRLKLRYEQSAKTNYDLAVWGSEFNNGYDAFAIDNSFTTQSNQPGQDDTRVGASSFKIGHQLTDALKLESISTYMRTKIANSFDGDWGNDPFWDPYAPYDYFSDSNRVRHSATQELRLTSQDLLYEHGENCRWIGGLYAQRLTEDTTTDQFSSSGIYDSVSSDYSANTGAVFGEVEAPLGHGTSIGSGLRFEQRNARYEDTRESDFSPTYSMVGGNVSLQHDITNNLRGYASVSRGFKGGGFNTGVNVPADRRQYDPEYLWNYETGVKGAFLKKRLTTNLAVFHDQRYDQQLKFAVQNDPSDPLSYTYITESSARGRSTGVELENTYQVLPWLDLFASGALMHSDFTSVPPEAGYLDGRAFSVAPAWQYSAGTRIDLGRGLFMRIEETGRDSFYFDDSNNQKSNPYNLFNGTVGYERDGWKVLLWSRNLFNQSYAVRGFYFGNEPPNFENKLYVQQGDPRTFGATVSYAF
jgi:outer membrane receptor protein involved in Fe transport